MFSFFKKKKNEPEQDPLFPIMNSLPEEAQDYVEKLCNKMLKDRTKLLVDKYGHTDNPLATGAIYKAVYMDISVIIMHNLTEGKDIEATMFAAANEYIVVMISIFAKTNGKSPEELGALPTENELQQYIKKMLPTLQTCN